MKHAFALTFVAFFLFVLGQALFTRRPAADSGEALLAASDMRRSEQAVYILDQARRFFRQGKFGDAFELTEYAKEKLGIDSAEMAELSAKSRKELEEVALAEAEKMEQRVREIGDLK